MFYVVCYVSMLYFHPTHVNRGQYFDAKRMFSENRLKLNRNKTELIKVWSEVQHKKLDTFLPGNITGNTLSPTDTFRFFCVWLDPDFHFQTC